MKRLLMAAWLLAGTLAAQAQSPTLLEPDEFRQAINEPGVVLLDVRTNEEFNQGHIEGAVIVDWYAADFLAHLPRMPKDTPILIYCYSGERSSEAKAAMALEGYTNIRELKGGFEAWEAAQEPVTRP